jgi:integrase
MGTIYRRVDGGPFYGQWTDAKGNRRREGLRTRDPKVARERLRKAELAATDPAAHREPHLLSSALDYLLTVGCANNAEGTVHCYTHKARHLVRVLGDVDVGGIGYDEVAGYAHTRLNEKASSSSVGKELTVLRRALKEAHRRGLTPIAPAAMMPEFKVRYTPIARHHTPHQLGALIAALSPKRRLWVALASLGGMRLAEVERVAWDGIDLTTGWIRVLGSKTKGSWRRVPIAAPLRAILEAVPQAHRRGLVAGHWGNVRRDLAATCVRAKVPRVTPNDLRRTFASLMVQAGVERLAVAHLLGHSSTRMVELVYGRLNDGIYRSAVATLPAVDQWDASETRGVPILALHGEVGAAVDAQVREISVGNVVPRGEVESPTRGFSGPTSSGALPSKSVRLEIVRRGVRRQ